MPFSFTYNPNVTMSNLADVCQEMKKMAQQHAADINPQITSTVDPALRLCLIQAYRDEMEKYWSNRR